MMSLQTPAFIPRDMRSKTLRIYAYQGKVPKGYIFSPWTGVQYCFFGVMELLLCLETLMDEKNVPRPSTELRGKREPYLPGTAEEPDETLLASFNIDVLFRYNSTWQGNLLWIEKGQEAQFRSALELLMLIDNVLSGVA